MKALLTLVLVVAVATAIAQGFHESTKTEGLPLPGRRKLVETALVLKAGDSFQTVTNALGKADRDQAVGGRSDIPEPTTCWLDYYLVRPTGATAENPSTDLVRITLDFKTQRVQGIFIRAHL